MNRKGCKRLWLDPVVLCCHVHDFLLLPQACTLYIQLRGHQIHITLTWLSGRLKLVLMGKQEHILKGCCLCPYALVGEDSEDIPYYEGSLGCECTSPSTALRRESLEIPNPGGMEKQAVSFLPPSSFLAMLRGDWRRKRWREGCLVSFPGVSRF